MRFNYSFPYPVLSPENDDYKGSSFESSVEAQKTFGELYITLQCRLQDDEIARLIHEGKAKYALHVECPQTSFRRIYQSEDSKIVATIAENLLRGKIEVHAFIIANEMIQGYTNPNLNEFYKDVSITYEKGNILALGEAVDIILHEDDLESQNLPSIVTIRRSEGAKEMMVSLSQDYIIIELPKAVYDQYAANAQSSLKETILSMVILPCLMEVFYALKENGAEEYSEYKWYQVMEQIFRRNSVPLNQIIDTDFPVLKAAQMVLQNPLEKAFSEIQKLNEGMIEE